MKMLILEGPDNLGKSTLVTQLKQVLTRSGYKVHVMIHPNRADWGNVMTEYAMGHSAAISIERQYLIALNCMTQYSMIPPDTDIILADRHCVVSNLIYFRDRTDAACAYRDAVAMAFTNTHRNMGIDYTCCMLLVGAQPFVDPNEAEHFETSGKWADVCMRYNRLKYTDQLPSVGIEVCAIDAFSAKGKLVDIAAGLFAYALKHGNLPQPLNADTPVPVKEGENPPTEVSRGRSIDEATPEEWDRAAKAVGASQKPECVGCHGNNMTCAGCPHEPID